MLSKDDAAEPKHLAAWWPEHVCRRAYQWADAMLRERGKAVRDNCVTGNNPEIGCPHSIDGSVGSLPTALGDGVSPSKNDKNLHHTQEPVAWAVFRWWDNACVAAFCHKDEAGDWRALETVDTCHRHDVVPLYRQPQPALADDERAAVAGMAAYFDTRGNLTMQAWGSLLRVLLERLA
jgi:hypothetical protein